MAAAEARIAVDAGLPHLALGHVTTQLLDSRSPLPVDDTRELLNLLPGLRVTWTGYPVSRVTSPEVPYGLDCSLPARSMAKVRGVGTAAARAVVTGGHVVQASAYVKVIVGASTSRQRWAYYAWRTGAVETINKARASDLTDGYLDGLSGGELLDLPAVASHLLERVQSQDQLDGDSRLRSRRTALVWAAELVPGLAAPIADIRVDMSNVYHVKLTLDPGSLPGAIEFCEYLALHDWLLTTFREALERSGRPDRQSMRPQLRLFEELGPVLEYLGHLWIPASRMSPEMRDLWNELDDQRKLGRQLQTKVTEVRDQVSLLTLRALEETLQRESFL
jgi:hypothetical protein